jgi:hypothetical protein
VKHQQGEFRVRDCESLAEMSLLYFRPREVDPKKLASQEGWDYSFIFQVMDSLCARFLYAAPSHSVWNE